MHEVVEDCGGVTLFPEQSRSAHAQACWIEGYGIDRRRVYVAGMSAGGAMASEEDIPQTIFQGGRSVTLTRHARQGEQPDAELWMVHGSGHTWTGVSPYGSYTDKSGSNASQEMRRFFLKQSLANRRGKNVA